MKDIRLIVFMILYCFAFALVVGQDEAKETEQKIRTVYGTDGRPYAQSEYAKGDHQVWGNVKLENGVCTTSINTSTRDGSQDVSFDADSSYFGVARAFVVNGNTYSIVPISGDKFVVVSSDTGDTSSVRFKLEGH